MKIELLDRLKKEAEKGVQKVLDELERQSAELGIDEFNGNKRDELIIKFDRFEYHLNKLGEEQLIRVKLGINLRDTKGIWINALEPIGNYLADFDLKGEFVDDFITINERAIKFDIQYWIETLNKMVPKRYFKRNVPEYKLVTYVSHSMILFQSKDYDGATIFIKRILDYLEKPENKERIDSEYFKTVKLYLASMFYYLKNHDLIDGTKQKDIGLKIE
jgi:hypothetical protein